MKDHRAVWSARVGQTLTHSQARRFYDRFVLFQEWQAFYENAAVDVLIRGGRFASAHAVAELGCGTGRLAERLLETELTADARYLGFDVSPRMVERTRRRLARFGARADVRTTDGSPRLPMSNASRDRFVSAYVFDLLSEPDTRLALEEAHRILVPGGLLCLASLSSGTSRASRALSRAWVRVHGFEPLLVGGCRPIDLRPLLEHERWEMALCQTVVSYGVPTQVVIAGARKL
jgi:ubiquinone/menaquinone biosynthesis C-methylase UbiE